MVNQTNIPAPRVAFIDERTGLMSREWYRFFLNLFTLTGSGTTDVSLDDVQVAPPAIDVLPADGGMDNAPLPVDYSNLAALENIVQGLTMQPPALEVQKLYSGAFYDTTDQTAAAANTAYAMTLNATTYNAGVRLGSPTSRVICDNPGIYNFQFSAQLMKTSSNAKHVWIWYRVNGVDISYSATQMTLQGNGAATVAAWNFVHQMAAGDYFELVWSTDDTDCKIEHIAAAAPVPDVPSVILTVTQVSI